MPSPFPGMNPLLELPGLWPSFHSAFIAQVVEALTPQIVPQFVARTQLRVVRLSELSEDARQIVGIADVGVHQPATNRSGNSPRSSGDAGTTAVLEPPIEASLTDVEVERQGYVEIREPRGGTIVTVIELLSPSNKLRGEGRDKYLAKRQTCLRAGASFVEIDLVRAGRPFDLAGRPSSDYSVMVARAERLPTVGLWPVALREPLPLVPIPLRPGVADARLDLGALLHETYDAAGFGVGVSQDDVDALQPSLRPVDATWARQVIAANA